MKPIFHSVAILASVAGIYFSYELSSKFGEQQEQRLAFTKENKDSSDLATATEKELRDEQSKLTKSTEEKSLAEQNLSNLQAAAAKAKREIATVEATLQQQNLEFDQLNKAMDEVKKILSSLGGDVTFENLPDKVKEIENDKIAKESKQQELATVLEGALKRLESVKEEAARLADIKAKRDSRIRSNSRDFAITAVNQEWGFVVIGAGANQNFTPQTKLLVERDGMLLGRIQPTSIEPNQTIADIDFESLAPGVRLQPGDRVIFAEPVSN